MKLTKSFAVAIAAVGLIFMTSMSASATVADGTLDTSFGTSGIASVPATESDAVRGIAVQSDGKIVTAGYYSNVGWVHGWDFYAARFNTDGSLDTTFATNGILQLDISGRHDVPREMAVQSDGKILIAGDIEYNGGGNYRSTLVRITADGALDPTFGTNGIWIDPRGVKTTLSSVAVTPGGKILVSGQWHQSGYSWLLSLNADGTTDTSFGTNGAINIFGNSSPNPDRILVESNGNIVMTGKDGQQLIVWRYSSSGAADNTFGSNGQVLLSVGSGSAAGKSIVKSGNDYVVFATSTSATSGRQAFTAVKFTSTGNLDPSFGVAGISQITSDSTRDNHLIDGIASPNGNFYGFGFIDVAGVTSGRVGAFAADGTALTTFGTAGFASGFSGYYETGTLQANGELLAAGGYLSAPSTQGFGVQRFSTIEHQNYLASLVTPVVTPVSSGTTPSALATTGLNAEAASIAMLSLIALGSALVTLAALRKKQS